MSGKGKHAEVNTARTRLDATLQSLVEKKDEEQEETGDSEGEPDVMSPADNSQSEPLPVVSPSKRSQVNKGNRKRKKKDEGEDAETGGHFHHSYVMKLFDRSVDMAQFDENTPLYPICRAWMKNQPNNRNLGPSSQKSASPDPEVMASTSEEEGEYPNIHQLPPPIKQEYGTWDLRMPEPLPQTDPPLDIHSDPDKAPAPEQLLLNHLDRWKVIRQRWYHSARINEMRYTASLNTLKEMFERQLKEG
ncbi:hypothetical protein ACJMK2_015819 [Sinanodonta woodiana]|uniref:Protein lin-37 homolog n=1 Tax=Sinanodonta woodiana TaxID=1069815 RepID=A0ABD3URM7_SINWO